MPNNIINTVLKGSFWVTLSKWIVMSLGMVSTIILARLLTPADFGLVAMAMLVTGFFDTFSRLGTDQYLIHKTTLTTEDINTAWTIQLITKILIGLMILLSAFFIPAWWNESQLLPLLIALAPLPIVLALKNIGVVLLVKEVNFKKTKLVEVCSKILSFIVTVAFAFKYQSYWCFIIGIYVNSLTSVFGSYFISTYRPQLCLKKVTEQWGFSQWTLFKGILNYLGTQMDRIIISKFLSPAMLGNYTIAQRINQIPSEVAVAPIKEVLFPALSHYLPNRDEFREKIQKTFFIIVLVTAPLATAMMLFSNAIIAFFLGDGEKWQVAELILPILAPLLVIGNLRASIMDIYTLLARTRLIFVLELFTLFLSMTVMYTTLQYYGLTGLVYSKVILNLVLVCLLIHMISHHVGISKSRFYLGVTLIILANLLAALCIKLIVTNLGLSLTSFITLSITGIIFLFLEFSFHFLLFFLAKNISQDLKFSYDMVCHIRKRKG